MPLGTNILSATDAAKQIASGGLTAEKLVEACLDRITAREDEVRAWSHLDANKALAEARARDNEDPKSALHGIPIGVKDVIDTHDMPTEYGSPIYQGHRPAWDAACIALLREAGGIVLGKTVTTEFATRHPGKTRNPHNLAHTPGGSSSGSAASVADFMVPLAFGTQTAGSVIRPSAYCGIVGFKPTFGTINRTGLKPLSDSQDTIGLLGRSVADIALLTSTLSSLKLQNIVAEVRSATAPRIGFCHTNLWDLADTATHSALEDAALCLGRKGAIVKEIQLPASLVEATSAQEVINEFETWRALAFERYEHASKLSPALTKRLARAGTRARADYDVAQVLAKDGRLQLAEIFTKFDVLLVPAAPGEAPEGLDFTGDPIFNQLWTLMHVPAVTLPVFNGPKGLPIGAQIVGPNGEDGRTLICAEWISRKLSE